MMRWLGLVLYAWTLLEVQGQTGSEPQEVGYIDLKLNLDDLVKKKVRVKGGFHYLNEDGNSIILRQDENSITVDISKLPQESQEAVKELRNFSEIPITVTGTVIRGGVQRDQPAILAQKLDIEDSSTRNAYSSRRGVVTVPELQVNPPRYLQSSVTMEGRFDFLQPGRETFHMWRGVDEVEVDFSQLSVDTKRQLMGLKNFSDQGLKVSGILRPPPTAEVAFAIEATSLQIDPAGEAAQASSSDAVKEGGVTYAAILLHPALYVNKVQTMKGGFELCDPRRKTMQIWQGSDSIEVYYRDVPSDEMELIESQRPFNSINLIITGVVRAYPKTPRRFMIEARRVTLDKGS